MRVRDPLQIEIDKGVTMDVNCQIAHLSFSAHADAKGIVSLCGTASWSVMLTLSLSLIARRCSWFVSLRPATLCSSTARNRKCTALPLQPCRFTLCLFD